MLRLGRRLRPPRRLWPILAVAVVGRGRLGHRHAALAIRAGASIMRLYEGTDTRCQDILVGAALAIGMAMWAQHRPAAAREPSTGTPGRFAPRPSVGRDHRPGPPPATPARPAPPPGPGIKPISAWEITSAAARLCLQVLGLVGAAPGLSTCGRSCTGPALPVRGRLLPVRPRGGHRSSSVRSPPRRARCLGPSAIRCSATSGRSPTGPISGTSRFSPCWSRPRLHLYGYPLLVVRIAVTLVVATGSFYLVEEPIRRGGCGSLTEWRAWLATSGRLPRPWWPSPWRPPCRRRPRPPAPWRLVGAQYSGPPVKVMLFGDSVAWRLGFAMLASQPQNTYDVNIDNGAIIGCGVVAQHRVPGPRRCRPGRRRSATPSAPKSGQWPAQWKGDLEPVPSQRGDRCWPADGRSRTGRSVGSGCTSGTRRSTPTSRQSLEQAVQVATSTGALMVLMTSPCFDSGEQDNGQPWPEDSATRLAEYNAMVRQVAAEHPATVQLDDFGSQLCPGGATSPTHRRGPGPRR